jgi:hypothetical protein
LITMPVLILSSAMPNTQFQRVNRTGIYPVRHFIGTTIWRLCMQMHLAFAETSG